MNLVTDFYRVLFFESVREFVRDYIEHKGLGDDAIQKLTALGDSKADNQIKWSEFGNIFNELTQENFTFEHWASVIWAKYTHVSESYAELLWRLKRGGSKIFYITNITPECMRARRQESIMGVFDGGVASCEVDYRKPDKQIYQILIDMYNIRPSECVFVDDKLENVRAACEFGFLGKVYGGESQIPEIEQLMNPHLILR